MLLAVEVHADRVVRAVLADPVDLHVERALGDVARVGAHERRRGGGGAAGPVDSAAAQVVRQLHLGGREGGRARRAVRDVVVARRRRRDDARARVAGVGVRVHQRARDRIGGERGDHLRRRAGQRAGGVGGQVDDDVLDRYDDLAIHHYVPVLGSVRLAFDAKFAMLLTS